MGVPASATYVAHQHVNRFISGGPAHRIHHDFAPFLWLQSLPTDFNFAGDVSLTPVVMTQATAYERVTKDFGVSHGAFESSAESSFIQNKYRGDSVRADPTLIVDTASPSNTLEVFGQFKTNSNDPALPLDTFLKTPATDDVLTYFRADQLHAGPKDARTQAAMSLDIVHFAVPGNDPVQMPALPTSYNTFFDALDADADDMLRVYKEEQEAYSIDDAPGEVAEMKAHVDRYKAYKKKFIFGSLFKRSNFGRSHAEFRKFVEKHDAASSAIAEDLDVLGHLKRIADASGLGTK
jgi:hypothetical protein